MQKRSAQSEARNLGSRAQRGANPGKRAQRGATLEAAHNEARNFENRATGPETKGNAADTYEQIQEYL